jgi:hypothetical protein
MKSELKIRSLRTLADAYAVKELRVNEEYQRGTEWTLSQKQSLIDSLLRGYQIPLFYVHLESRENHYTRGFETTAWLVDGQQRLAAIVDFRQNKFALPDPAKAKAGSVLPPSTTQLPPWTGKKFEQLETVERDQLMGRELLVIEMTADHPNEVRDLFIRLQSGRPLTAQQKRDAWPGEFTNFVIRHAGKPSHRLSNPKRFFTLFRATRAVSVDDGAHYVDGLAETRKFFAGLAMAIMVRERSKLDFVDLKGSTINEFYLENLLMDKDDPAALRVVRILELVAALPGFERLKAGRPMSFQWAFHLVMLVDSLDAGRYASNWREDVIDAFLNFRQEVATAQLRYRETRESLPHYDRFGRLLSGSGSDTAEVIRVRHAFLLSQVHPKIALNQLDPHRLFDPLEKEVIWNRDRGICRNPICVRQEGRVLFGDATVHHVVEHASGGKTTVRNGVLVCPECHANRKEMLRLTPQFKDYLDRIYQREEKHGSHHVFGDGFEGDTTEASENSGSTGKRDGVVARGGSFRIVVNWGALDVDRETQVFTGDPASELVVQLLVAMLREFGKPLEQQLTELPVIRFPLSRNPKADFVNRATGKAFGAIQIPETDLYFCPHSDNEQKVKNLTVLFSRLTLPDGRGFPEGSVQFSLDSAPDQTA